MAPKTVRLFTLSTCSHCKAAKRFLAENGVEHEFIDVDLLSDDRRSAVLEEVRAYNPRLSYPTIIIGGERVIVGFREQELREALDL
ncbi:MAG: glutaredoxin family protein [Candidatus Krumholzibacteria bacterium]|nr:glutaredoxin family protein [Candidatus Krumholzibacteria bacterium]